MSVSRRTFLELAPAAMIPLALPQSSMPGSATLASGSAAFTAPPDMTFPSNPPAVVREMVIASHGNLPRVRELVGRWPALSRAAIDWGYGDWEDALGADTADLLEQLGYDELAVARLAEEGAFGRR